MTISNKNNLQQSIANSETSLKADPDNVDLLYKLGHTFLSLGDYDQAVSKFQRLVELDPNDHESINFLANSMFQQGSKRESLIYFERAINLYSKEPDYFADYGDALTALGQLDKAREIYEHGLKNTVPGEEGAERIMEALEEIDEEQ